ncbi:RES family NAD+ phosphorylase [Methylobacillus sp.]|uniref:RES family NAD+ phosphorylase n=1 Tax=Methylobacillus sp. TaxID=56818 RepID=UPI002FE241B5
MSTNRCFLLSPHKRLSAASFQQARRHHGRWHRTGQQACYGFEHPALAMLEREVITNGRCLMPLYLHEARLPDTQSAPLDLRQVRAGQEQAVGGRFFDNPPQLLAVSSSSVCAEGTIYLISPKHPDFEQIKWSCLRAVNRISP